MPNKKMSEFYEEIIKQTFFIYFPRIKKRYKNNMNNVISCGKLSYVL